MSDLATLLVGAALDPALWQRFLDELTIIMPEVRAHIIGFDVTGLETGFVTAGYDPSYLASYGAHYAELNAWAPTFLTKEVGKIVPSQEMCPDDRLTRTEFYADWVRPQDDIRLGGGAIIENAAHGTFVIGGNIPARAGPDVQDRWLALVHLLMPHMQMAWSAARAEAARILRGDAAAVVTMDANRRVAFVNEQAGVLLAGGDPIRLCPRGRLHLSDPKADRWLDHRLAERRAGAAELRDVVSPCGAWTVRLLPVNPDRIHAIWPTAMMALTGPAFVLQLSLRETASPEERLRTKNGLTPAEAGVAIALASGKTVGEIAGARGVSLHTVRNQIKSAMAKCGVRRQTELVALVLGSGSG